MKLDLTDVLCALSFALDKAESEVLGVDTGHCRRVSYIALLMGEEAGFREEELRDFAGCCLLHDNALSEFIREELTNSVVLRDLTVKHNCSPRMDKPVVGGRGEARHRCVLGLYRVLETLTERFPCIFFECCAGGGNRTDLGMLSCMPRVWLLSTAIERIPQYEH